MPSPLDSTYNFYTNKIRAAAQKYNIPAQLGIWQLWQESRYKPNAVSSAGAKGVAQFMPGTAAQYGVDVWDVDSSIDGWGRLMRDLYKQFGRWDYALAGYNAGPGNVNKYNGVPPFKETQDYVRIILGNSKVKALASAGFKIGLLGILTGIGIATAVLINNNE
tara:strand:+ start:403 stop:891 length:489 start_codon:yes stop_codon:yes gene_type:complete